MYSRSSFWQTDNNSPIRSMKMDLHELDEIVILGLKWVLRIQPRECLYHSK